MAALFGKLTDFFIVLGLSMVPLVESKIAVPLGITLYKLPFWAAIVAGTLGMVLITVILMPLFAFITKKIRSWHPNLDRLIDKFFSYTYHRHTSRFEKLGVVALFLYVALPIPFTGVRSGSLLAYLFGIKKLDAIIALGLGSLVASTIVALATIGVWKLTTL
jgi:uncharacterized membrane protein